MDRGSSGQCGDLDLLKLKCERELPSFRQHQVKPRREALSAQDFHVNPRPVVGVSLDGTVTEIPGHSSRKNLQ
jgi:hypothetical protein